jgi:hypothetical protein
MGKDGKFWLTVSNLLILIFTVAFMLFNCIINNFTFYKEYALIGIPILIYLGIQFAINYNNLLDR